MIAPINEWDIRPRAVLIAILPTMVMALVLMAYFLGSRLSDLEEAHTQRGKALARQLAAASEYGVFSGNLESLRKLATSILQEQDVVRVAVFSPQQEVLADSSKPPPPPSPGAVRLSGSQGRTPLRFQEPVSGPQINVEDAFLEPGSSILPPPDTAHGEVLVEMSQDSLRAEQLRLLQNGLLMALVVLTASAALAIRMSRGISGPILRIASAVSRFGQGDMKIRVQVEGGKSLQILAAGVNDMADKLSASREELERRVDAATRELKEKKEEAERANQAKTRFLAAASHDLRQPMHALGLFVAELVQKSHASDTRKLVEQIAISAETMENLLDSLLDISRLDAGVLDRQIKPFALQPLLDRIEEDHRRDAELRGLRLRMRPSSLWADSDPLLLERILNNLITNALRYAPGGTVLVACRKRGRKVRIEVRDNGPGIAPEAQKAIFQEFVQLDNPERNRAKGLGLGLAIVRRLTTLLQHDLTLCSAPGQGALFAVELPAAAAGVLLEGSPPPASHALHGLQVLLVDDDALAVASTTSLLESWGCQVTSTSNADVALDVLPAGWLPDIMICDHRMDLSGAGHLVVIRLRQHFNRPIPAIILSGDTSPEITRGAQQAGIPLLHKPVRPARLRALLQRKTQA
ncbi:ATP-binding protein [Zoogloea sp.]|uniref:hybrid sensor histidine kinase/response regulator n=1 Tax=Zoogloea sp. TaxID=49181 RepID=UPI0026102646|nr:ATP-binding protein [Zoogloea sp.]MDD3354996.1 ATP-binding protein [Zoogloea sp.]